MTQLPPLGRRRLRRRMFLLLLLPLSLLLAEGGTRVLHALGGETWRSAQAVERMRSKVGGFSILLGQEPRGAAEDATQPEPGTQALVVHPFFGFWAAGGVEHMTARFEAVRGARGRRSFDVVVVGGSVAGMTAVASGGRLREVLEADERLAQRAVSVQNFGVGGFKQPQQLNFLAYLLIQGAQIDAVVNIDGFNEVALGANNTSLGAHPLQPSLAHWKRASGADFDGPGFELLVDLAEARADALDLLRRVERLGLAHSALLGTLAERRLDDARARVVRAQLAYERGEPQGGRRPISSGPEFEDDGELGTTLIAQSWAACSRAMDALCREHGVLYVHLLQPTLHDEGSKPLTAQERRTGRALETWVAGVRLGYPKLRAAGRELVEHGVAFVDASRLFEGVEDALYFDACHFIERGTDMLAEAAARAVLQRLP